MTQVRICKFFGGVTTNHRIGNVTLSVDSYDELKDFCQIVIFQGESENVRTVFPSHLGVKGFDKYFDANSDETDNGRVERNVETWFVPIQVARDLRKTLMEQLCR